MSLPSCPGSGRPCTGPHSDTYSAVAELRSRLQLAGRTSIGFPGSIDFDYSSLSGLLTGELLNNIGDPYVDGAEFRNTKAMEREVVGFVADLLRAPTNDRWGYVTSGSTEGTLCALYLARRERPDAIVYHSEAAHYSVRKAADILSMPAMAVRVDDSGRMDCSDLAAKVLGRRGCEAVVVATIGTTMTEAVDDVREITAALDAAGVERRWVHADAALAGIPLALLEAGSRPGFDFVDGADSVIVSGHKFIGCPFPSGVFVTRASRHTTAATVDYILSPDTTILGSRNGHAPLLLWYAIRSRGIDGLRRRAQVSRGLATYAERQLARIGWEAWRNPNAFTVVIKDPPHEVRHRWSLPSSDGWSHIVCMPGVTRQHIDAFIHDLRGALQVGSMS